MKKLYILGLIIFLTVLLGVFLKKSVIRNNTRVVNINGHKLSVEIADTEALRNQGLSGRTNLTQDSGMLFIFPTIGNYQFWMKEMKFPLDFVWIDKDSIVDLTANVAPPQTSQETLPTFTSKFPFDKVIELNSGMIKSLNIKIGDKVLL